MDGKGWLPTPCSQRFSEAKEHPAPKGQLKHGQELSALLVVGEICMLRTSIIDLAIGATTLKVEMQNDGGTCVTCQGSSSPTPGHRAIWHRPHAISIELAAGGT